MQQATHNTQSKLRADLEREFATLPCLLSAKQVLATRYVSHEFLYRREKAARAFGLQLPVRRIGRRILVAKCDLIEFLVTANDINKPL